MPRSGAARRRRQRENNSAGYPPVQNQQPVAVAAQPAQPPAEAAPGGGDAGVGPAALPAFIGKGRAFIVMGAPAAGKGTQCKLLAKKFGFVHLSTGDIFRELAKQGTELGLEFKEYMDRGCYVPDAVVMSYLRTRLSEPDVQERGCLLDGFPRTADQAQGLLRDVKVDGMFIIQVPDKTLITRAEGRRIDPVTGEIYNLKHVAPPAEIIHRLQRRDRDDQLSFRQRITVHKDSIRRVLPLFSGHTKQVDGTLTPEEVFQNFCRHFESLATATASTDSSKAAPQQDQSCAICFSEPANFMVVPCGHQCGCEECLKAVQQHSGRCPICRLPVQGIQRVFRCGRGDGDEELTAVPAAAGPAPTAHTDLQDKLDSQVKNEDDWSDDEGEQDAQQDPVSLVVDPCKDVEAEGSVVEVMISARIPDMTTRLPADICCVVDVSGSMGARATYETEDGQTKDDGLSVLDIVKHAVKTVFKALQDGDRFSLVAFSGEATTALGLTEMTAAGQQKALEALEGLQPTGATNIWAGLLAAMDNLRTGEDVNGTGRRQAILLLTDGQPNQVPPRGHLPELRDYKDSHPGFTFQLNTFGFGYNLDSELLLDLAKEGQGTFAFIPDAVIVGTTFVNCVANVLSTISLSSTLSLMPRGGAELAGPCLGDFHEFNESWGRGIHLGPLQSGQSRELVVPVRFPPQVAASTSRQPGSDKPYLEIVLTYPKAKGSDGRVSMSATSRRGTMNALVASCRGNAVTKGYSAIDLAVQNKGANATSEVNVAKAKVAEVQKSSSEAGEVDGRLTALHADVDGRMSKALQGKERFNRWGKHYLRALIRAHQLQVCTNFMDPGLQPYGGSLFRELRDKGDEIFLALPPPKPSQPPRQAATCASTASPAPTMNTYYAGAGGGCFAPSSTVRRVAAGPNMDEVEENVPLEAVRAGDVLRVADGGVAAVRCVVRIARKAGKHMVALPGGLRITPGHPVHVASVWMRARDVPDAQLEPAATDVVYNVVLDRCHMLLADGVECATWGHGLQGEVISHPFFGTELIVNQLAQLEGWFTGEVIAVQGTVKDACGDVVALWCPADKVAQGSAVNGGAPLFSAACALAGA